MCRDATSRVTPSVATHSLVLRGQAADEAGGGVEEVDGRVAVGDDRRLEAQRLQHPHLHLRPGHCNRPQCVGANSCHHVLELQCQQTVVKSKEGTEE